MIEAFETKKTVDGIKGPSFLTGFPGFKLDSGVIVEGMHNVYLACAKKKYWTAYFFQSL